MSNWVQHGELDWQITESDGPASIGATIGYGLIDESPQDYGTLQRVAEALRRELARPVETASGVSHPDAQVFIDSDAVHLAVAGDRASLPGAWARLPQALSGQAPADLGALGPVDTWGWPVDAFARIGVNAFSLGLATANPGPVDTDAAQRLLARLHPESGQAPWVFTTTDSSLISPATEAFGGRATPPGPPPPGRAHGLPQAGLIRAGADGGLYFTAVLPRSPAGYAAGSALLEQFGQGLRAAGFQMAPWASMRGFGSDIWLDANTDQVVAPEQLGPALHTLLASPISDVLIDRAISAAHEHPSRLMWESSARAHGIYFEDEISPAQVRAAISSAMQTLHVTEVPGLPALPGLERLKPPVPEEPMGRYSGDVKRLIKWTHGGPGPGVARQSKHRPWLRPVLTIAAVALLAVLMVFVRVAAFGSEDESSGTTGSSDTVRSVTQPSNGAPALGADHT